VTCLAVLATAACKDDTGSKADKANPYIVKHAREDVDEITKKLATKSATLMDCVIVGEVDEIKRADAELAAKLTQLCGYDVPVSLIEKSVDVAEPARKAKPDAIEVEGCDVEAGMSVEELDKYGKTDDRAKALIDRLFAACPLIAKQVEERRQKAGQKK
jgi:hypothetical protein